MANKEANFRKSDNFTNGGFNGGFNGPHGTRDITEESGGSGEYCATFEVVSFSKNVRGHIVKIKYSSFDSYFKQVLKLKEKYPDSEIGEIRSIDKQIQYREVLEFEMNIYRFESYVRAIHKSKSWNINKPSDSMLRCLIRADDYFSEYRRVNFEGNIYSDGSLIWDVMTYFGINYCVYEHLFVPKSQYEAWSDYRLENALTNSDIYIHLRQFFQLFRSNLLFPYN